MGMKTVRQLIEELKKQNPDDFAAAYSAEDTGIVIYPSTMKQDQADFDEMTDKDDITEKEMSEALNKTMNTEFIKLPYVMT